MLFLKAGNCPAHSFLLLNLIPEISEDKLGKEFLPSDCPDTVFRGGLCYGCAVIYDRRSSGRHLRALASLMTLMASAFDMS